MIFIPVSSLVSTNQRSGSQLVMRQKAPTSFACRSPVEVKQNVCKPGELMNRLLLPHTDTIAAAVRQAPDDEATIIMTRPRQLDRHHAPTERLHTPIKR